MEATELIESDFWESDDCRVLAPPGLEAEGEHLGRLLDGEEAVIFATSGSSGAPKWVLFRREALLASARAVNLHLQIGSRDSFLVALPLYHVGGFGMGARAFVAGCALHHYQGPWDAARFRDELEETGCTLTSLVPTQVHDLVSLGLQAPASLRVAVVGGGRLNEQEGQVARDLGWPLLQSYGMTETGSQVATDTLENIEREFRSEPLLVLPDWEYRLGEDGCLHLRGGALCESYLRREEDEVIRVGVKDVEGWFRSRDLVEIKGKELVMCGRADRKVKIMGELVDVQALEDEVGALLDAGQVCLLPVPDERRGWRLLPVVEGLADEVGSAIERVNRSNAGYARLEQARVVERLPRTALGKVDVGVLREEIAPS
ncbi:MAG: AMP-binding protein [Verrucomicrobiota bacterium]|nr:AMP-binding protein [Verrucomicrobiota bacterium]